MTGGGPDDGARDSDDIAPPLTPSPVDAAPDTAIVPTDPPPVRDARPGLSTFTIDGRQTPALFVIGWLGTLLGLGIIFIGALASSGREPLIVVGLVLLSIGLIAAAGSQGAERRARGGDRYHGPSPLLVFAAVVPVSLLASFLVGIPLSWLGADLRGPIGQVAAISVQAVVYVALIRLLVVDTGALSWAAMGLRGPGRRVIADLLAGALWAVPVVIVTAFVAAILTQFVPEMPESPLPPTGETVGFALQLLAGVLIAPFSEELLFRGMATTAWVRDLGPARGILRAAMLFAFAHVIGISGTTAGSAFALAAVAFLGRVPVALALGWLFVRRDSLWAAFGLHAAYNAILLILAEMALRSGALG